MPNLDRRELVLNSLKSIRDAFREEMQPQQLSGLLEAIRWADAQLEKSHDHESAIISPRPEAGRRLGGQRIYSPTSGDNAGVEGIVVPREHRGVSQRRSRHASGDPPDDCY